MGGDGEGGPLKEYGWIVLGFLVIEGGNGGEGGRGFFFGVLIHLLWYDSSMGQI